jgi:hypothetical protein
MKTSNIILISLFGLVLIFLILVQLYFKSIVSHEKAKSFEFNPGLYSSLIIDSGWDVKIEKGEISKITFSDDSIRNFILMDRDALILSEIKNDSVNSHRTRILITADNISQIKISGNSLLYYQTDFIDSLFVKLYDKSIVTIRNGEIGVNKSTREKDVDNGTINYVSATVSDKTELKIHLDINSFEAELKDSCYCGLSGKVQIEKLNKSKTAHLRLW